MSSVRVLRRWGWLSPDGMTVELAPAPRSAGVPGGPYRSSMSTSSVRVPFDVVRGDPVDVALADADSLAEGSHQAALRSMMHRHTVAVMVEAWASGAAVVACRSDHLDEASSARHAVAAVVALRGLDAGWWGFLVRRRPVPGRERPLLAARAWAAARGPRVEVHAELLGEKEPTNDLLDLARRSLPPEG